ncbi:hypothetical protein [Fructobacillus tropaeoli]|uniref:Uncharacterized protein n=1 Tax=Fructobacillus tropaeoli TaxID=709323 RepID=A0A3F3H1B0_9LACO|nr:hypothetical protein [Fructobacillus tropaeoli]GAP04805.1 hypothetical protein FTRO_0090060 [Fructobacillus tropaeoli]
MVISDWITLLGIILSLGTSAWSLWQTNRTLKQSNKLELLEKRFNTFQLSEQLYEVIVAEKSILKLNENYQEVNPINFRAMINCTELESLRAVIPNPFDVYENPLNYPEAQNVFLKKISDLNSRANLSNFLFDEPASKALSTFIKNYADLLDGRRHYAILLAQYRKEEDRYNRGHQLNFGNKIDHYEFLEKHTEEPKIRKLYLEEPIRNLQRSFDQYEKARESIKDQIKLPNK